MQLPPVLKSVARIGVHRDDRRLVGRLWLLRVRIGKTKRDESRRQRNEDQRGQPGSHQWALHIENSGPSNQSHRKYARNVLPRVSRSLTGT